MTHRDSRGTRGLKARTQAAGRSPCEGEGQGGFALLVSLIAIVGLTALATGGFFLADSERQTATNHHAAVEAYHLANAGLNEFLGSGVNNPGDGYTDTYDYPGAGGDAQIRVDFVGLTSGGDSLYRVASRGRFEPNAPGGPIVRDVGTIVMLNESVIPNPPSAIASGGGITKNGSSGKISGADNCGQQDTVAGVRVPEDPGYTQSGGGDVLVGDPPADSVQDPFDFIENGQEWWSGMKDGTTVAHDHVLKADDSSSQWPDFSNESGMPVTYVDKNNIELGDNQDGKGLLIIKGNATFKGNFDWDGIILVGGSVTDHGQGQIEGAVMTGLNVLEGDDVSQDDLEDVDEFDGQKKYLFDSCVIDQVQSATASLAEVPSTWFERF